MIILGYICFLLIGLVLGLIGGGGSILGVPVLVYIMSNSAEEATAYSLFIVGLSSIFGSIVYLRKGEISAEALMQFALASIITVFCMRRYVIPAIPAEFSLFGIDTSKHTVIMLLFSVLIVSSAVSMIRKKKTNIASQAKWDEFSRSPLGLPFVILLGVFVGMITGFVGAGGGFIIVPILIFFLRLKFRKAIGTSLSIIALNSLIGFTGNIGKMEMDWFFLITISLMAIIGILIGTKLSGKIPAHKLRPAFGWFTLFVGIFVLLKETVFA